MKPATYGESIEIPPRSQMGAPKAFTMRPRYAWRNPACEGTEIRAFCARDGDRIKAAVPARDIRSCTA